MIEGVERVLAMSGDVGQYRETYFRVVHLAGKRCRFTVFQICFRINGISAPVH